ncbi:MAG: DUF58 domain-containing protein [Chloroflexi bacterium]|nr:DUF58 domain-containing protein [Chloroflexota bacterium]
MTLRTITPVAVLALVVVIALATGFGLLFRMSYALALALVTGFVIAWTNQRGLSATVERPKGRTQSGEYFEEHIAVRNNGKLPGWSVEIEEPSDLPGHALGGVVDIKGRPGRRGPAAPSGATLTVRTLCSRRGVFHVGPVKLISRDPLGFFRFARSFGEQHKVIVYPAMVDLPRFHMPAVELPGERNSRNISYQSALQAFSVRDYVHGDALNRVHWPSTAHHGKLMVKEFEAARSSRVWIIVDMERKVQAGQGTETTDETASSAAASIARRFLTLDLPVGLICHGDSRCFLPAYRSSMQLERILDALALVKPEGETPLDRVLIDEERAIGRYDSLIVISPSLERKWVALLGDLLRRHASACVVSIDPAGFGGRDNAVPFYAELAQQRVASCVVKRGEHLSEALATRGSVSGGREWLANGSALL